MCVCESVYVCVCLCVHLYVLMNGLAEKSFPLEHARRELRESFQLLLYNPLKPLCRKRITTFAPLCS